MRDTQSNANEESVLFRGRNQAKSMSLVQTNCPISGGPGADEQSNRGLVRKKPEQRTTDSSAFMCRSHICMTDQIDVANMLDSHDADESGCLIPAPEVATGMRARSCGS
jgi:hypothetical protein